MKAITKVNLHEGTNWVSLVQLYFVNLKDGYWGLCSW